MPSLHKATVFKGRPLLYAVMVRFLLAHNWSKIDVVPQVTAHVQTQSQQSLAAERLDQLSKVWVSYPVVYKLLNIGRETLLRASVGKSEIILVNVIVYIQSDSILEARSN